MAHLGLEDFEADLANFLIFPWMIFRSNVNNCQRVSFIMKKWGCQLINDGWLMRPVWGDSQTTQTTKFIGYHSDAY